MLSKHSTSVVGTSNELHRDLLRISDLIFSEEYCLYKLFDALKLRSMLSRLADASIRLPDVNKDYLGYDTIATGSHN